MGTLPRHREVSALFEPGTDLTALAARLEEAGTPKDAITLCSPLPLESATQAPRAPLWPYIVTIAAGVVGIGVGIFFAGGTAALYPLSTGGKPIVAAPVLGIISYETMMLVAVFVTFITMIVRIVGDHGAQSMRATAINDGMVGIVVQLNRTSASEFVVRSVLEEAGGTLISMADEGAAPEESGVSSERAAQPLQM